MCTLNNISEVLLPPTFYLVFSLRKGSDPTDGRVMLSDDQTFTVIIKNIIYN